MSSNSEIPNNPMARFAYSDEEEEEACRLTAMHLASASVLPMALRAAIELDLLGLIVRKSDSESTVSASELVSQLQTNNPDASTMVDRILRLLSAHSVLTCTVKLLPGGGGETERRYGLTPLCRFFTENEDGISAANTLSLFLQDRTFMEAWYHLKDSVLDGGVPFNRAHGKNPFEYAAVDPRFNQLFNRAMSEPSTVFMKKILEKYHGFEGLKSLADVGGGIGTTLKMILSKYPSIKGINFDLPHVLEHALSYPGVENVGGDMFVSLPKVDAIFMKWICHDWSDEHCKKLLKNCYEALPENGKVIVAETIFPEDPNGGPAYELAAEKDVFMMTFNIGGKERTEREFQALGKYAGFQKVTKICCAFHIWIMEFRK